MTPTSGVWCQTLNMRTTHARIVKKWWGVMYRLGQNATTPSTNEFVDQWGVGATTNSSYWSKSGQTGFGQVGSSGGGRLTRMEVTTPPTLLSRVSCDLTV